MKNLLCCLVAVLFVALTTEAQVTNLGPLNINLASTWTTSDLTNRTDVIGWNCWVYPAGKTNGTPLSAFFLSTTNYTTNGLPGLAGTWAFLPGSKAMTNLPNGSNVLGVSTVCLGNLVGPTNYASFTVNQGQPSLNSNMRLWEFITAASQVPLPPLP